MAKFTRKQLHGVIDVINADPAPVFAKYDFETRGLLVSGKRRDGKTARNEPYDPNDIYGVFGIRVPYVGDNPAGIGELDRRPSKFSS